MPYLLVWALRRPGRERLAAGIGGFAPDADSFTAPLAYLVDPLYFLGHRGISHSLLGAPLYALAVAAALSIPWWGRRWPKLRALRFTLPMLIVALLASYTHLMLDALTFWGVPAMFPGSGARFGLDWYYYGVTWAIPLSFWFCWGVWKGRADDRFVAKWGALLLVALLLSGGARLAFRPDAPEGGVAYPAGAEWRWTTVARSEEGYEAIAYAWGREVANETVRAHVPDIPGAVEALAAARASPEGRRFFLYAKGPFAETVEPAGNGEWNVTLVDMMRWSQLVGSPRWFPAAEDFAALDLVVGPGGVRERESE